ncbi:LCP family protein [Paenibacillus sp. N1-5-1-14]|uniref:LCP family protein n=1 Tax=Paenibacillus radicibacter TaxID=2972488 RepID=UPI002158CBF0|nr:LCP family protein [Paenibacillus radicibacter]MCR8641078.1 LCP family protein [Paenibacillus radicibacter]
MKKRWYRKWKLIVPLLLLVIATGCGFWMYGKYEPGRHFEQNAIPVLVQPKPQSLSAKEQSSEVESEEETASKTTTSIQPSSKEPDRSFNILIIGTDARDTEISRSDVIMVAHVNPTSKEARLLSIPRDTRVNIDGVGYTKVNHAHILGEGKSGNHGGTESVMQVISNMLNITINYYVKTNFEGFERFIDTIGGLDVQLDEEVRFTYTDNIMVGPGLVHLNGEEALMFVRERKSLSEGDFGRQKNQALILRAIAKKLLQASSIKQMPSLITQVKKDVLDTNFTDGDLISLAWMMSDMNSDRMEYSSIPGHSAQLMDPLVRQQLYYWIPDQDGVHALIERFFKS